MNNLYSRTSFKIKSLYSYPSHYNCPVQRRSLNNIKILMNDTSRSLHEVIFDNYQRVIFDLEYLPDLNMLHKCVDIIYQEMGLRKSEYPPAITINTTPVEKHGISSHVIVPVVISNFIFIRNIVSKIANHHPEEAIYFNDKFYYSEYVRLPYQWLPRRSHDPPYTPNYDDFHRILKPDGKGVYLRLEDCPNIGDFIIQNITGLKAYEAEDFPPYPTNHKLAKNPKPKKQKEFNYQVLINLLLSILIIATIYKLI